MNDTTTIKAIRQTHVLYEIEIEESAFKQLIAAQEAEYIPYEDWVCISLHGSSIRAEAGVPGVESADYNPDADCIISCLIDIEHDNEETREAICRVIHDRVERARICQATEAP